MNEEVKKVKEGASTQIAQIDTLFDDTLIVEKMISPGVSLAAQIGPVVVDPENWAKAVLSSVCSRISSTYSDLLKNLVKEKKIQVIFLPHNGNCHIAFQAIGKTPADEEAHYKELKFSLTEVAESVEKTSNDTDKIVSLHANVSACLLGFDPNNQGTFDAAQLLLKSIMTSCNVATTMSHRVASNLGPGYETALAEKSISILPSERNGCYQLVIKANSGMNVDSRRKLLGGLAIDNKFHVPSSMGPAYITTNHSVRLMGFNPDETSSFNKAQSILKDMAQYSNHSG
ncbi:MULTISPECIES: hypothetical protein [unclassified Rhizobacter]|uniref:hypothetical protein n=1 Tax=unclassified Rhizobacter TaxID=2640088 RepID=UPI000ACDFC3F|nr:MULTISPECIES: hypothetical protein [unclassified Rhizobacter]